VQQTLIFLDKQKKVLLIIAIFFAFSIAVRGSHSSDSPRVLKILAVPMLPYCLTQETVAMLSTFQQYAIM